VRRSLLPILSLVLWTFAHLPLGAQGLAVTPEGWQRTVAETGTVFYRCQSATCPANSVISYRQQRDGPPMAFETFQRSHVLTNQRMVEQSNGALIAVDMIEIGQRKMGETLVYTAVKLLRRASGQDEFYIATLFFDAGRNYSIVASATSERAARANMDQFLPIVMLAAQLR
jgi:hypothetical protein